MSSWISKFSVDGSEQMSEDSKELLRLSSGVIPVVHDSGQVSEDPIELLRSSSVLIAGALEAVRLLEVDGSCRSSILSSSDLLYASEILVLDGSICGSLCWTLFN